MKLSISNIAWPKEFDGEVYTLAAEHGFTGIDIAPSRVWDDLTSITEDQIASFTAELKDHGLAPAGMQSLLYQKPECTIFDSEAARGNTFAALKAMIELAGRFGVAALVFGSPKNRLMGEVTDEKMKIAREFFAELGEYALLHNTCFCIEPNPTDYGADFITTTAEAFELVREVGSEGLKVNVDLGTIEMNGEDPIALMKENIDGIGHVHISAPHLTPVVFSPLHAEVLTALHEAGYDGWVAIEMLTNESQDKMADIAQSLVSVEEGMRRIG